MTLRMLVGNIAQEFCIDFFPLFQFYALTKMWLLFVFLNDFILKRPIQTLYFLLRHIA